MKSVRAFFTGANSSQRSGGIACGRTCASASRVPPRLAARAHPHQPFAVAAVEAQHRAALRLPHHPEQVMRLSARVRSTDCPGASGWSRKSLILASTWTPEYDRPGSDTRQRPDRSRMPSAATGSTGWRRRRRGPICGFRAPTGRSAPGCCCCPAGGGRCWPRRWWAGAEPVAWVLLGSALGAWLMRGAGCTWNDITDRNIDAKVARTRSRPIPSGQVSVTRSGGLDGGAGAAGAADPADLPACRDLARRRIAGADRGLSFRQAVHLVAAGVSGAGLQLGRAAGLGGGDRHRSRRRRWRSISPASPGRCSTTPSMPIRTRRTTR